MRTASIIAFLLIALLGCSKASPTSQGSGRASAAEAPDTAVPESAPAQEPEQAGSSAPNVIPTAAGTTPATPTPVGADASCAALSERAQNERTPADIIIAVDNSGSMDAEIVFVREQLNAFSKQIIDAGVDARIILITAPIRSPGTTMTSWLGAEQDNGICIAAPLGSGSCPDDTHLPHYIHVPREVDSNDALDMFIATYPMYQAHLRPNASKTFVVVTDDNAVDSGDVVAARADVAVDDVAEWFVDQVAALPGDPFPSFTVSGIYCFSRCADADAIGTVYEELVQLTGGVKGDLCEQNFAPVFDALAVAVIETSGLECSWAIPAAPSGETFDRDRVNVQFSVGGKAPQSLLQVADAASCADGSGWHYDDPSNPTRVIPCASTCSELQQDPAAQIDVLFGCTTQQAPE
jgi:hypothetical protein